MKSTALCLIATACCAAAGTAPLPCTAAALPQPCAATTARHSIEIGIPALFATERLATNDSRIDIAGADLTWVHHFTPGHGLFIRVAGLSGNESQDWYVGNAHVYSRDLEVRNYSLTAGYRYTASITPGTSLYAAAGIGVAREEIEFTTFDHGAFADGTVGHDGFAYSLELGVKYNFTPRSSVHAGYEFYGSNAKPSGTKTQLYHGIRFGAGYEF